MAKSIDKRKRPAKASCQARIACFLEALPDLNPHFKKAREQYNPYVKQAWTPPRVESAIDLDAIE